MLAELYAGTRSREDRQMLDRISAAMRRVDRLLTPDDGDWVLAGQLIARRIRLHADIRPRDHLAAVLIVLSAARHRSCVVTANLRHFEAWRRLSVAAGLDVTVRSPDSERQSSD